MRTPAIPLFRPFAYLRDVTQISPQILVEEGYIAALIDIDNTLVPRSTHVLFEDVENWVGELKAAGLKVCLLSNNWHRTVFGYAERLGVPMSIKR
jgi:predicted HAD superfamily phosphohydrolase YqeG